MNPLLFLNSGDFTLSGEHFVCQKYDGLLIILFYSTHCAYCGPAREALNMVASQFSQGNCKFGIINVTQNSKVVDKAKASKTPIKFVPFVMAFFKRAPLAVFQQACTQQNLVQFVRKCYESIQGQVDSFGVVKKEDEIPAFTTGKPVCEDGVCYLSYDDAYKK